MSGLSAERRAAEEGCAQDYARLILEGGWRNWRAVNFDIERRWSLTALRRVKERAWSIVNEQPAAAPKERDQG